MKGLFRNEQNATIQKHKKTMSTFIPVQNKWNIYENIEKRMKELFVKEWPKKKQEKYIWHIWKKAELGVLFVWSSRRALFSLTTGEAGWTSKMAPKWDQHSWGKNQGIPSGLVLALFLSVSLGKDQTLNSPLDPWDSWVWWAVVTSCAWGPCQGSEQVDPLRASRVNWTFLETQGACVSRSWYRHRSISLQVGMWTVPHPSRLNLKE